MFNYNKNGLKLSREQKQISAEELANYLKIDVSVIYAWEAGAGTISLDTLIKISQILDSSTEKILFSETIKPLSLSKLTPSQKKIVIDLYNTIKL